MIERAGGWGDSIRQKDTFGPVRDKISGHLHTIQGDLERIKAVLGSDTEIPDYAKALRSVNVMQNLRSAQDIPAFFDRLFDVGIPPGPLFSMSEELGIQLPDGTKYNFTERDIKDKFYGGGLVSAGNLASLNFKFGGDAWLRQFIIDQRARKQFDIGEAHQVQKIANSVSGLGPRAAMLTRLMFMCSMPDSLEERKERYAGRTIQELRHFAEARLEEDKRSGGGKESFERFKEFFSVYSDITAGVLTTVANPEVRAQIDEKSRTALSRFLRLHELQNIPQKSGSPVNPFETFRKLLLTDKSNNPWLVNNCKDTPFDAGKFGLMISADFPRGLIIDSLVFLNDYPSLLLANRVEKLVKDEAHNRTTNGHERSASPQLREKISETLQEIGVTVAEDEKAPGYLGSQMDRLRHFLQNNHVHRIITDTNRIHPFAGLLRIIDPVKIIQNDQRKQEYLSLVSAIEEVIKRENKLKGGDNSGEHEKKIAIIASSVQTLTNALNSNLDIPIPGEERDLSIRLQLTRHAQRWFDEEILKRGPFANLTKLGSMPEGPLIIPRDLLEMSAERLAEIKADFNNAAGVSRSKRGWIARACSTWIKILPNHIYERIKSYSFRMAEAYYKGEGKYDYAFYSSATAAINDVIGSGLLPRIKKGAVLMISNQEFSGITEDFIKRGAVVADIKCNDRKKGIAKTPEMIFEDMKRRMEFMEQPPIAILLSSKTRFGDSIGHVDNTVTPNSYGLSELIKKLRTFDPTIPIIVDGCQSAGRNDRGEELNRLGCHVYISSGGKAHGIGNVGFLAIRRVAPEEKAKSWLSHIDDEKTLKNPASILFPGSGTEDIRRIGEFGTSLQLLMQTFDTWKLTSKDEKRPMREQIADHMQRLTYHAIQRADEYATSLVTNPAFPSLAGDAGDLITDLSRQKQFGCQVVYPVHRKGRDYNGILTVTFPNIAVSRKGKSTSEGANLEGENYVKEQLGKLGNAVEQCHFGRRGVRISFHYLHEQKDIDGLFAKIEEIHTGFLNKLVASRDIKTFDELRSLSPNVPPDWMED